MLLKSRVMKHDIKKSLKIKDSSKFHKYLLDQANHFHINMVISLRKF